MKANQTRNGKRFTTPKERILKSNLLPISTLFNKLRGATTAGYPVIVKLFNLRILYVTLSNKNRLLLKVTH